MFIRFCIHCRSAAACTIWTMPPPFVAAPLICCRVRPMFGTEMPTERPLPCTEALTVAPVVDEVRVADWSPPEGAGSGGGGALVMVMLASLPIRLPSPAIWML